MRAGPNGRVVDSDGCRTGQSSDLGSQQGWEYDRRLCLIPGNAYPKVSNSAEALGRTVCQRGQGLVVCERTREALIRLVYSRCVGTMGSVAWVRG